MLSRLFSVPAFYASLAALFAAIGIEMHQEMYERVAELLAALFAIIGIITAARKPS